jgi:hypothetical protein
MGAKFFRGIDAGTSSASFDLTAGNYSVEVAPLETKRGEYGGLISLQLKSKASPSAGFVAVGPSTDFSRRGSVTLRLDAGTYRFTATRTAAIFASVDPAT